MEQQIRQIINDIYADLEEALALCGETLCAEGLADSVSDRMYDQCEEYRAMPHQERRGMTLKIAQQYV